MSDSADTCTWTQYIERDGQDVWETGCGKSFIVMEDTPTDNGMRFCCYCGKALVEARQPESTDEDEDVSDREERTENPNVY